MSEWYYIGHYGQLGPLTLDQIDELVQGGVVARDTFVWRSGMADWIRAETCTELIPLFKANNISQPPPPPNPHQAITTSPPLVAPAPSAYHMPTVNIPYQPAFTPIKSDKSRTVAGVLQIVLPGIGRMYAGYGAIGALQLVLSVCLVGWIWSIIDGIFILSGGVKLDGYGRQMGD